MFLDGEDFKSVWQLAHNWAGEDPNKTDVNAISPKLKTAIHRLMHAIVNHEISARSRRRRFFEDDSLLTFAFDSHHYWEFYQCLRKNKFDKDYLNNLYVKRYEVITWCKNVAFLDLPPCWVPTSSSDKQITNNDDNNSQAKNEKREAQQQRNAAFQRHKPIANLKKECIHYWLQHQNYSNNQAASKFYESLTEDKQKLLKPTNASKTLSIAISNYKNREKLIVQDKLPRWLENFNPENPQT